jgi:hypothetical protein
MRVCEPGFKSLSRRGRWRMARIEHYEFGRIVVDGREERRDLIILPGAGSAGCSLADQWAAWRSSDRASASRISRSSPWRRAAKAR